MYERMHNSHALLPLRFLQGEKVPKADEGVSPFSEKA
jgi:hypothetical protein